MLVLGAGVGALALTASLFAFLRGGDSAFDGPSWAPVAIAGERLPEFSRGRPDPATGRKAPEIRGTGFDGSPVVIAPSGRPLVVLLLAHWCPHCRQEVPSLTEWIGRHGMPAGADMVAVSTWADAARPNFPPGRWLRDENWPVSTLVDDRTSSAAAAFGMRGTPFWIFIDAAGVVRGRVEAELQGDEVEQIIARLSG